MNNDPLTTAALLGTMRLHAFPPAPHEILEAPWKALTNSDPATAVLHAAALESAALRAGRQPIEGVELPTPVGGEEKTRRLPPAAVPPVLRMLEGEYAQGLPEWLRLAAEGGFRVPARILPALFDHGTRRRDLRPAIRAVAGSRGVWLARQRERWKWVLEETAVPEKTTEKGTPAERLASALETSPPPSPAILKDILATPVERREAVALAFRAEPATIPGLLEQISKLPDLSSSVEEFARALEFRQSYLPHLTI